MSILSDTVRGVGRLLFPVRCPVCGGEMPPGSRVVCTRCRYAVPLTGFCYATYNPLWERLSALVPVEQASAFLYFIPGSGWRELIHRFKYDGAWRLARDMGVWYGHCLADSGLYDTVDRIVPVPLHWRKRLRRGYNQAEYLAEGIARALRAEVDRHSVRRIRNNPAQALHRHAERWDNVEGIFAVRRPERLAGHHLLLVDDVLFSGRTIRAALEALLDYGRPRAVELLVLIDRGHRELPIHADYVGRAVNTSRHEHVDVLLEERDGEDAVRLGDSQSI